MEVVALSFPVSSPFNREYEKTPSPEKEEKEELVLDFTDEEEEEEEEEEEDVLDFGPDLEYEALKKSYAADLVAMEKRMAEVDLNLAPLKVGKDGKMMELVSHELIRAMMKCPPHPSPLPDHSIEALRSSMGITDEEELETIARSYRGLQTAWDTQNDIIQQYRTKGYAYAYPRSPLP